LRLGRLAALDAVWLMRLMLISSANYACEIFNFRGTAGTAIKCPYRWFLRLLGGAGTWVCQDTKRRSQGQQLPRAQRPTCALFPYLNECLPPFEARLASRFCCRFYSCVTMHVRRQNAWWPAP